MASGEGGDRPPELFVVAGEVYLELKLGKFVYDFGQTGRGVQEKIFLPSNPFSIVTLS